MTIFSGFHWPTFFISLAVFILVANLWNVFRFTIARNRAANKVKQADVALKTMLQKLRADTREIEGLIAKFKQPKS